MLAGGVAAPMPARAADPTVPPLTTGPIVLDDGRVLPVMPAWVQDSSVQAEMLAAHAGDQIQFAPGAQPEPRSAPGMTLGLYTGPSDPVVPLALAPASGPSVTLAAAPALPNGMRKEVLGFLPYWMLDAAALQSMQYQLVTTIAYFGVAARADGTLATSSGGTATPGWSGWNSSAMTNVINAAHARGVRVVLTITMMAWDGGAGQAALLGSATARALLVNGIVAAVGSRAADGVNLDFEPVAVPQRDQYTSFVRQLKAGLVAGGVGSYLTVDTTGGAATWATGYDLAGLTASGAADAIFVMGYDYSWSGSARAGGVAPMDSPYILDVVESVDDYLAVVPAAKIIWGVPYYGRTWQTTGGEVNATTRAGSSGASKAYYYTAARDLAAVHGRRWDGVGRVPWFAYQDGAGLWTQGYYDDATSLAHKYDMVNAKGLGGVGMWTLLMDRGDNALWNLIANKFVNDTTAPMGGVQLLPAVSGESAIQVTWAATDVGSGVQSYSVQARDRSGGEWLAWMTGTSATTGRYVGVPGHSYEFRVAARDFKGNVQPWLVSSSDPGASPAAGGFARVTVDSLNVRSGAGTGFSVVDLLSTGSVVSVQAGPIAGGAHQWYLVQFGFSEWPSAAYPRLGWVAAGAGATSYLAPIGAPNVTTISSSAVPITPITDLVVPSLTARSPTPNATNVGLSPTVTVQFSEPVHGLSTGSMVLSNAANLIGLPATVTYYPATRTATLTPSARLLPKTTYRVALSGSIKDMAGNPVAWTWWTFSTIASESYAPPRTLLFAPGTYTGYRFNSAGTVTARKPYTLAAGSSAPTTRYAALVGQSGGWYLVSGGVWSGYWIRNGTGIALR